MLKNVAGESVFGVFLFSSDSEVLQHVRARYSLRFLATKLPNFPSFFSSRFIQIAVFCFHLYMPCRLIIISISTSSPPATLMPSSCYGKGSAPVATPRASKRRVCLGRRAATCCISRSCAVSAFSVCSICEWQGFCVLPVLCS